MKKLLLTTIITLLALGVYGQATTNKRVMLDSLNNKMSTEEVAESYAPLASPTLTGTTTTAIINVGGTTLAIDSIGVVDGKIAFWDGPDTLGLHINMSDVADLSDYAVMLVDSMGGAPGNYVTRKALVDSLAAFSGGVSEATVRDIVNDSIEARLTDAIAGVIVVDSTGNAPGNYVTRKALVDSLATVSGGVAIADVRDEIADSLNVAYNLDSEIIPLFIFGAGGGLTSDTALFNNNVIAGVFYNSGVDTLVVTEIRGVMAEGTGTETINVQVSWHATFKSESATNLNSAAFTITSITTGTADTSFNGNNIPPGVFVWCTLSGASKDNKPTLLSLTMSGYKRNRARR